jgi:hypothetical protein
MDLENILSWMEVLLGATLVAVCLCAVSLKWILKVQIENKQLQQGILSELQQLNNKLPPR